MQTIIACNVITLLIDTESKKSGGAIESSQAHKKEETSPGFSKEVSLGNNATSSSENQKTDAIPKLTRDVNSINLITEKSIGQAPKENISATSFSAASNSDLSSKL